MAWWGELLAKLASFAADIAAMRRQKLAEETGAAKQREVDDAEAVKGLLNLARPVTDSESDRLWSENREKYERRQR